MFSFTFTFDPVKSPIKSEEQYCSESLKLKKVSSSSSRGWQLSCWSLGSESELNRKWRGVERAGLIVCGSGRLDNREELLDSYGLRADSDCSEILFELFQRYGERCWDFLSGDWVGFIAELPQRVIRVARSSLGVEPLVFRRLGDVVELASLTRLLPGIESGSFEPNWQGVSRLVLGESWPADEITLIRGVCQVPIGHFGSITCDDTHWTRLSDPVAREVDSLALHTYDDYVEAFRWGVSRSLSFRLNPQEKHLLFMSGGMDTGSLLHLMLREGYRVDGLHYTVEGVPEVDEQKWVQALTEYYSIDCTTLICEQGWDNECWEKHPKLFSMPFGDLFSDYIERSYSWMRRQGLSRYVSGHFGDTLFQFSGYDAVDFVMNHRWQDQSFPFQEGLSLSYLWRNRSRWLRYFLRYHPRWLWWIKRNRLRQARPWLSSNFWSFLSDDLESLVFGVHNLIEDEQKRVFSGSAKGTMFEGLREFEVLQGVVREDPLYDSFLVHLAQRMPYAYQGFMGKKRLVQRSVCQGQAPEVWLNRREKTNFFPAVASDLNQFKPHMIKSLGKGALAEQGWLERSLLEQTSVAELWFPWVIDRYLKGFTTFLCDETV